MYFDLQRRHPEVHQAAKIVFDRSKHCVDGLLKCAFCFTLLGDMQAMEKHIAAGGCMIIKQSIAKGVEPDTLLKQLQEERKAQNAVQRDDTTPGEANMGDAWDLGCLSKPPHQIVSMRASDVHRMKPSCLLCRQKLVDIRRVKMHWRAMHAEAWTRYHSEAEQHCRTQAKALRRPRQFCDCDAKDLQAHSRLCPMMFQAMAVHLTQKHGALDSMREAHRALLPRCSEQEAAYKSFKIESTPLSRAFSAGKPRKESQAGAVQQKFKDKNAAGAKHTDNALQDVRSRQRVHQTERCRTVFSQKRECSRWARQRWSMDHQAQVSQST